MEITSYQEAVRVYANHHKELGPYTLILSLGKHFGDLSDKLYKILEGNEGNITDEDKFRIGVSIGDMLNDLTNMATDMGMSIEDVFKMNLKKLEMAYEEMLNDKEKFNT